MTVEVGEGDVALDDAGDVAAALRDGLATPPIQTVTEWAAANRYLDSRTSAEPGRYRPERTPYAIEPMDRLSTHDPVERVVLQWGAQLGKTEVGNNWIGSIIDYSPGPAMAVQSTVDLANDFSKQRIAPMVELSPALREKVAAPRSRDSSNTLRNKEFAGGALYIVGANAPAGLRSKPIRFVFFDEVDSYPADAGGEGDPIDLAMKRTATFRNRKILQTSTPTVKGESRIETAYLETDQRRYFVPCPACDHFQALSWDCVKWPAGRPAEAVYQCESCDALIADHEKPAMLARGEWRATREDLDAWDGKSVGFHLSSLYSPWVRFGELASEFVVAKDDPVRLQVFVNTRLAETFEDRGESPDGHALMDRREGYGPAAFEAGVGPEVPAGVVLLTCSVDTQDDRLEAKVVGWGIGEEGWIVDVRQFWGDPSARSGVSPEGVWSELDVYLDRGWRHASGVTLRVSATCVDSGGHHAEPVREFARYRSKRNVWAIVGSRVDNKPIWPKKPSRTRKGVFYYVGVNESKWKVYRRLRVKAPGPGFLHFPDAVGEGYFDQLTVERRRTKYLKGRAVHYWWKPDHARNEAFDLMVYNVAALHGLYALGRTLESAKSRLDAWVSQFATAQKPKRGRATPDGAPPSKRTSKRSGFLKSRRSHFLSPT